MRGSLRFSVSLACLVFLPAASVYARPTLQPGEYITDGGSGHLIIQPGSDGKFPFSVDSVGGNRHSCGLEGYIQRGRASVRPFDDDEFEPCIVTFSPTSDGIQVTPEISESCRALCGARASFDGFYLKPSADCDSESVSQSRNKFKRLYDSKAFQKAHVVLYSVLKNCSKTLNWLELGEIRNDLAITEYHLGRMGDCLKTLEPLGVDTTRTADEEVAQLAKVAPSDADALLPIVQATQTNIKLCSKSRKK